MIDDELWHSIRVLHFRKKKKKSWIARELGLARNTVAKYLAADAPPAYTLCQPRGKPVSSEWEGHVRLFLEEDRNAPRKQHHTAKRIFDRLVEEHGFTGSLRTVQYLVSELRPRRSSKSFIPLVFEPGKDAQVDYCESFVQLGGVKTKVYGFEMRLNYSRKKFQMYFPSPNMESFLEGHAQAFNFFGGVPARISYDNLSLAVVAVGKGKTRTLTKSFQQLMGFYAFESNFCTPGKSGAHEKGGVEGGIGFSRRNWMVPMPKVASIDELNRYLLQKCVEDGLRKVEGQSNTIDEAFCAEQEYLHALPVTPFDTGIRRSGSCVDGYQTIVFESNRYSVPVGFSGKPLWFKTYWDRVQVGTRSEVIAEHERSYSQEQFVLKPEHYFDLLEQRPHSIPYARPLVQAQWPKEFWVCYESMTETMGSSKSGRHFVRILRMNFSFGREATRAAILEATSIGALNADVVQQILDRGKFIQRVSDPLDISSRPELAVDVKLSDTFLYQQLLGGKNEHHIT